jgi:pimeloyl-ACP methyl ester carboxylesterase
MPRPFDKAPVVHHSDRAESRRAAALRHFHRPAWRARGDAPQRESAGRAMMPPAIAGNGMADERITVNGIELEVLRRGPGGAGGPPALVLHGIDTVPPTARFLDLLGRGGEIIAPSAPGFGNTPRPDDFDTIYDLVRLWLALIDDLPYDKLHLIGLSFGGWLAAEVAVACRHKLATLVLVDPLGIKLGDRESRDILDVFNLNPAEVRRAAWHDPAKAPDYNAMSDAELVIHARNRDALCLYAWHPCLYNPQLKQWLPRIRVPTLVLWGASDRIVTPDYGRAYAGLIPGARFELVEEAGHHPELEQPDRFADAVAAFLRG